SSRAPVTRLGSMASGSIIEDQGLFGPDSAIWRVNRESAVTLGGTCALLMQLAHPRVAAGVRDHSRFEEDTVGRLRRTLDLTMTIVFGSRRAAMHAIRLINTRHRAVKGAGYSALDPELLMWVHATLVYSGCEPTERSSARWAQPIGMGTTRTRRR